MRTFALNTRDARTQIKLNLFRGGTPPVACGGEIPVLAVTSVSGAPATRRIVMLKRPIPPTVITGLAACTRSGKALHCRDGYEG